MSKMDELRALREARYQQEAGGGRKSPAVPRASKPATKPPADRPERAAASAGSAPATDQLCGHRSMNGRTCTREQGHAAKSHRYS